MDNNVIDKLKETELYIKNKIGDFVPKVSIILGSGLKDAAENITDKIVFQFKELPYFNFSTVVGHENKMIFGKLSGVPVLCMQGRFHYYEGYSLNEIIYPIRLMKILGSKYLVITCAAGGINLKYKTGDIVLIKDHINFMGHNCLRGVHHPEFGERFPDMSQVYDKELFKLTVNIAKENKINIQKGVYMAVAGPSYETPAEIKAFRKLGADIIGMSVVPEAVSAYQMGMRILGFSYVANMASQSSDESITHKEVIAVGKNISFNINKLINDVIKELN